MAFYSLPASSEAEGLTGFPYRHFFSITMQLLKFPLQGGYDTTSRPCCQTVVSSAAQRNTDANCYVGGMETTPTLILPNTETNRG
jgi:hypothetical protein